MKSFKIILIFFLISGALFSQRGFVENKGQVMDVNQNLRPDVKFYYENQQTALYFKKNKVVYSFTELDFLDEKKYQNNAALLDSFKQQLGATIYRMDMLFKGANPSPNVVKGEEISGNTHFYLNKRDGIRDVGIYSSITYKDMYNNIDVVFYELPTGLKYDIVLKKGADINDVNIQYLGAEKLNIENGQLIIDIANKTLVEDIPLSFIDGDKNQKVEVQYKLSKEGILSFKTDLEDFNTLTIDPVLEWATYLNPTAATTASLDYANSHLDASGNFFIYGQVYSAAGNYPVIDPGGSAYNASYNSSSDLYIAKFDVNRALVWSTYLGGSSSDQSYGSNVIASRGTTLHIVGERISDDAPFTNGGGLYVVPPNNNQAFWARFNSTTGALSHLTGIGGGYKPSIEISNGGNVGIIMEAYDFNNPLVMSRGGAYNQAASGGSKDMFFMLFNTSFNQTWGTFLGGPAPQENFMFRFDNSNNIVFIGESSWFGASTPASEHLVQRPGAYYQSAGAGGTDVLLGMFNSSGALVWNTLYGGDISDARRGQQGGYAKILIDPTTQEITMFWNTTSTNLPTLNSGGGTYYKTVPTHASFNGSGSFWNYAAYFARFNTSGAVTHASYWYNSTDGDLIHDVTFGGCNKLYVVGRQDAATFTKTPLVGGFNLATGGQIGLFQLDRSNLNLEWSSHLASDDGYGPSIAGRTDNPRVYVASEGYNTTSTMVNPGGGAYYQGSNLNGTSANFSIWQLHPTIPPEVNGTTSICEGQTTTLTASGGAGAPYRWYANNTTSTVLFTGSVYTTPALSANTTYYVSSGTGLCISSRTPVAITVSSPTTANNTTSTAAICENQTKALSATPSGGTWSVVSGGGIISGTTYTPANVTANTTVILRYTGPTSGVCPGDTDDVTFTVNVSNIANNTTTTTAICETATKALVGSPSGGTWSVQSGGGTISGTTYTPANVAANTSVTVRYTIAANGGCPATTSDRIFTVEPTITPTITSISASMCNGDTRALTGTPAGGTWSVVSGPGSISGTTLTASGSGTIQVRYRILNACGNNDATQNITVSNSINVSITSSSSSLCENSTRTLTGTPTGGTWTVLTGSATVSGGVLTPTGTASVRVEYAVTSTCGNGADTVDIIINPEPIANAGLDYNICAGDSSVLTATGGSTYTWNPGGGTMASQTVFPITTTTYGVNVISDSGCVSIDSVTVFVQNPGVATVVDDALTAVSGEQTTANVYSNDVGEVSTVTIINGAFNGVSSQSGGIITYQSTDGYTGNDSIEYSICDLNCQVVCDTGWLRIIVETDLKIPQFISPNNDGMNDYWFIEGLNKYPNASVKIFNRWGRLVYEGAPYTNDWDGKDKNMVSGEMMSGTFFYVLELGDDNEVHTGYIQVRK